MGTSPRSGGIGTPPPGPVLPPKMHRPPPRAGALSKNAPPRLGFPFTGSLYYPMANSISSWVISAKVLGLINASHLSALYWILDMTNFHDGNLC